MAFRKVLIAVDSEPTAANAADVGVELARTLNAQIALIHTVERSLAALANETGVSPQQIKSWAREEGKRLLVGFRERLALQPSALEFLEEGTPATEIVNAAKRWNADLIVIGSHGRGGMQRALLGSVAEGVMRNAPCPVMVVRVKE